MAVPEISVGELADRLAAGAFVLDVRQHDEYVDGHVPGAVLGIENPQPGGSIALATGSPLLDRVTLDAQGTLRANGDVIFGKQASDKVLFHGATGSGAQGADPGALSQLTAADVATPADIAQHMNEQRDAINALRDALLQQGLIGP